MKSLENASHTKQKVKNASHTKQKGFRRREPAKFRSPKSVDVDEKKNLDTSHLKVAEIKRNAKEKA